MTQPVDAHCHLDFDRFDSDREEVIDRCSQELEFVVNAGRNLETNRKSLELQESHEAVVATLGLHPTHADDFDELEEVKRQVRENNPVAVGEIGLDHHHVTESGARQRQEEVFREMVELAGELEKPVVVHSRDAEERAVEILKELNAGAMLHCFNGSVELAREALESGMKIGVATQVLYSSRVRELVEELPLESMLLETDSPFLYRGGRNEPVNVRESAAEIADLKGCKVEKVIEATTANARQLFR
ncbi:MAG: TatD family hydrolase [Candidatus Nanohaloarchaea archaeon]